VWEGHYNSVPSAADCQRDCQAAAACLAWTWDQGYHGACWHKTAVNKVMVDTAMQLVTMTVTCRARTAAWCPARSTAGTARPPVQTP
jgi:hypothetical protein